MLAQIGAPCFAWKYPGWNPTTTPGVVVTPGAGSKGAYAQLISGANLVNDVYGILLWIIAGNTSTGIRDILVDVGIDPAGGTTYSYTLLNDIFAPQASNAVEGGRWFYFPVFVKAGSSIGARGQSNAATTFRVTGKVYGLPRNPHLYRVGQYSETIGVSGNGGTPFTCGNTGAEGNWTLLGTTTRACWWWQLAYGHNVGTTTAQAYLAELGVGDGTAGGTQVIISDLPQFNPGTAEKSGNNLPAPFEGFWEVPAGSSLYVRGSASGTAETTEAVAVGVGG